MKIFKLSLFFVLFLSLVAGSLIFIQQNSDPMSVNFLSYTAETYKWLVLLLAALAGAILASIFFVVELILLETRNVRLRRLNSKLERALALNKPSPQNSDGPKPTLSSNETLEEEI